MREKFFPDTKQSEALNYAVVCPGKVIRRRTIIETRGEASGLAGSASRFHVSPDNRLFVVHRVSGAGKDGRRNFENRIAEILPDGTIGPPVPIPLRKPFTNYFNTTVRAGSPPSWTLEMLGQRDDAPNTISDASVSLIRGSARVRQPTLE